MYDISIIIPTFNRARRLKSLLDSITKQDDSLEKVQVIIVDDGSTDKTQKVVSKHKLNTLYVWQENKGVASARNTGLTKANSEIVSFLADDYILQTDYCSRMVKNLKRNVRIVKPTLVSPKQGFWARLANFIYDFNLYKQLNGLRKTRELYKLEFPDKLTEFKEYTPASGAAAFKIDIFRKYGNFKPEYVQAEDAELGFRLYEQGVKIHFDPKIKVVHKWRGGFFSMIKQFYIYSRGTYWVKKAYPKYPLNVFLEPKWYHYRDEIRGIYKNTVIVCRALGDSWRFALYFPFIFMLNIISLVGVYASVRRDKKNIYNKRTG